MGLVVLMSASGSPGVTTTALGLAIGWPRPALLVEADPTGGSAIAAGYLRGNLVPAETITDLALAERAGALSSALTRVTHPLPGTVTTWLPSARSHDQARTLTGVWEPLTAALHALADTGEDVIVDAGRLGLTGSPAPIIHAADLALLVTRTDMVSLAGARSWARTLRRRFDEAGVLACLGILLIGEGRPFHAREVAKVLELPVVTVIAWDPGSAQVLSHGTEPARPGVWQRITHRNTWGSSALARSLAGARDTITTRLGSTNLQPAPAAIGRQP